jgi:hypothetical protein
VFSPSSCRSSLVISFLVERICKYRAIDFRSVAGEIAVDLSMKVFAARG